MSYYGSLSGGDEATSNEAIMARLDEIHKTELESLKWRKYATIATVAGALFAMVRLTDIWIAVKRRRREST